MNRDPENIKLFNIIEKYSDTVDSKRNDPLTVDQKRKTWIRITNEFNSIPGVKQRDVKRIKRCYENKKARSVRGTKQTTGWDYDTPKKVREKTNENDTSEIDDSESVDKTVDDISNENVASDHKIENIQIIDRDEQFNSRPVSPQPDLNTANETSFDPLDCTATEQNGEPANSTRPFGNLGELMLAVKAHVNKSEAAANQQKELHNLAMQRERLKITLLEQELNERKELHMLRLQRDQEVIKLLTTFQSLFASMHFIWFG